MMNIMLSGDADVYYGLELVIYSTLTHNKNINWYIFTMDIGLVDEESNAIEYCSITDYQKAKLKAIVNYLDPNSNITFIDAAPFYSKYLSGGPNEFTAFTPYAALRLIADVALPYVNDLLYFDCDVAVMKNFESMYENCRSQKEKTCFAVYAEDAFFGEGEMISGVMFLNLDTIRKDRFFERARKNYNTFAYRFPDQMALRDAGPIEHLPSVYGYLWDWRKTAVQPYIIHFTNEIRIKIYSEGVSPTYFYRVYPEFDYVKQGCKLIDSFT